MWCISFNQMLRSTHRYCCKSVNKDAEDTIFVESSAFESTNIENKEETFHRCSEDGPLEDLHQGVCEGDIDKVKVLVCNGLDVNQLFLNGEAALHVACEGGHLGVVEVLLEAGANVNIVITKTSNSPLHVAVAEGHRDLVELLLDWGANVEQVNKNGESALYLAGKNGNYEIVEYLMGRGAKISPIEECSNSFNPPLCMAAADDNSEFVTFLLHKGARVNQVYKNGETALHIACGKGHYEIVEELISGGADINRVTVMNGSRPSDSPLFRAASSGHSAVVRLLLDHGAELNWPNGQGETALYAACSRGDQETASLLIERGANVDVSDVSGHCLPWHTPLYLAAWRGNHELVKLLLDSGADVNRPNRDGFTPLNAACDSRHLEVIRLLVERGAELTDNIQITQKQQARLD